MSSQYKGVHFGKYTSKRTNFAQSTKAGPGPGEYDIEPVSVDIEHYHMKNMQEKKSELNVPRYPENAIKNAEKEVGLFFNNVLMIIYQRNFHLLLLMNQYLENKRVKGQSKYQEII